MGRWVLIFLSSFIACLWVIFVYSVCALLHLFASVFNIFAYLPIKKKIFESFCERFESHINDIEKRKVAKALITL